MRGNPANARARVQGMPNEVVDQQSTPTDPQTFAHELGQLLLVEMMSEKAATDQIEGAIVERQGERVGYNAVHSARGAIRCG